MKTILHFFIFLITSFGNTMTAQTRDFKHVPPVSIPNTQQLTLQSKIVANQEYVLHINLPGNYNDTTKNFPVVYLLDSQWDFPLLSSIYGQQYYDGFIPEVIIVGITWGGANPNYDQLRARDLTPPNAVQGVMYGNAANFLGFIKNELTPFVESTFRVKKNDRTLVGSSFGGLFTLYALFNETSFFQKYILTSPATSWGNEAIYKIEKEYSAKNKTLPVRLYMAAGQMEDVNMFTKWVNTLESRNYGGLNLQTKVLENIGHSGTKPEGYTRGMQWAFKRPAITLSSTQLSPYLGTYLLGNDSVKVVMENNMLVGISGTNEKLVLTAETENDFYSPGGFLLIHFKKDKTNKVSGFELEQYNNKVFARKID